MKKRYKMKKQYKKIIILLLGVALISQLIGNTMLSAMAEDNSVTATYEVGVEGNNVMASLTKNGTMTLSGSGDTKDYTSDTMPFQDNISNIKDIVVEEGVTSIGNAMFYNCKDVNGKLIIPSTVVEIGDYAFGGDSYDSAPKITKIENSFTQSNVVVETPVEKKTEERTTEKSTEEQTTPIADTTQQDAIPKQEEQPVQETVKTVKTITEQQIGQSIFVSGQNGGYSCAETNKSFIDAVKEAGYVRADRFVRVKMDDSITQEVPVIEGQLVLPSKPDTLGVPAEDALTAYQFAGWTVEGSNKVLSPKDNYSISDDAEELNLTSQWQQTWKINPKVKTEAKEETSIYSVIDSNTGKVLENVNGYIITVQWQINKKDKEVEKLWENIENATSFTYERKAEAGDTANYFRAKLSINKQSKLRNLPETEVMTTDGVNGVNASNPITIIYDSNSGTGTIDTKEIKEGENYKPEENSYIRADGKVFIGWKVILNGVTAKKNDDSIVKTNDIIQSHEVLVFALEGVDSGSATFVAQWGDSNIVYLDPVNGNDSNDGATVNSAVKTIDKAYEKLKTTDEGGTVLNNNILLLSELNISSSVNFGNKPATFKSLSSSGVLNLSTSSSRVLLNADTIIEKIHISMGFLPANANKLVGNGIYAQGYKLIMGNNISNDNDYLFVYGGLPNGTLQGDTNVTIYSGKYRFVYAGGFGSGNSFNASAPNNSNVNGKTMITIFGGSFNRVYGGCNMGSVGYNSNVYMYGGIISGNWGNDLSIVGGSRYGIMSTNTSATYSANIQIFGGTVNNSIAGATHAGTDNGGYSNKKIRIKIKGGNINGKVFGGGIDASTSGGITVKDGVYIEVSEDANVTGDIYGGGYYNNSRAKTTIQGDIEINVLGGTTNSIYGGSYTSDIAGNVSIILKNAKVNGIISAGGNGSATAAGVTGNTTINIYSGNLMNNIYCGAYSNGVIKGNSILNIYDGNIGNKDKPINIYGGGYGANTLVNGSSKINISNGDVFANIFGAGESGKVITSTNINITGGIIHGDIYGAGNNVGVNQSNITINNNPNITGNVYGGSNASGITTESIVNINGAVNTDIYGGGNGAGTTVTTSTVNIESAANITGNIFGGGELGVVKTSNVNLKGGTIAGKVFGGGNNVGVTTSSVNVNGIINLTENDSAIFGGSNAQGTTDTSNVNVNSRINKNVYGGGLGLDTTVNNSYVNTKSVTNEIYGGGKEGKVKKVIINLEYGSGGSSVFGGGHLVGVDETVEINAKTNSDFTNIYGGSNEKGIVKNPVINHEGSVANIFGGGKGADTITYHPFITVNSTDYTRNIYGGGEEGITKEGAEVTITAVSTKITNIYGAGIKAGVEGDTKITIADGAKVGYVYGGSYESGEVTGTANINISGKIDYSVYGGGYGTKTIVKNTNVVTTPTAFIDESIYGGSKDGIITENTEMEINGNVGMSIYGAGEGATSNVMGNTHVVLFGANVGEDVFGGGSQGGIAGDSHVDLLSGTVNGSAYGGSDQALVQGNSKVHMGIKAATNQKIPTDMRMIVENSIFGGGNTTDNGKAFDASNPFVLGNSEVLIDQEGYGYADFSIGKNILGDGNMCVTAGNKNISIKNYRDRDTIKTLSSIQRATTLTLDRTWIELTGAMDSANLLPTMEYSLSRIDTLRLDGNVSLNLYKEVNLVRALESYFYGAPMDELSVNDASGNAITLQQGIGFELRTNEDVSRPGYGTVVGYTRLGRYDKENKPLTDGVYVLGGYDEANTNYGFVAGEDVFEKPGDTTPTIKFGEKLTPETDSKSWNNWRLGRRVDTKTFNLYASDRPSSGKTEAVMSSWAADGSIYRLDKDSVKITNQNGNTEAFNFVDPETLMSEVDKNTFGLEISTGQNGWLEQGNVGYVKGSTKVDSKNELVLNDTGEMVAINNSEVFPLINVTLSNLNGITTKDDNIPVTVSFDISTYTKQADGTEMKTGTMTINVNVFRNNFETYADTTVEAGKNYKGATQVYTYGQTHNVALTISKASSITLQFARKEGAGTAVPTNHDLDFSKPLPKGTKITMIDKSANDAKYYHYEAITDVSKIPLSDFIANDSTNGKYTPITAGNGVENYIFIIDFAGAPTFEGDAIDVGLSAYNNSQLIKKQNIVFSVSENQRIYTLSSLKNDENTYTRYSIGSTVSIDLSTAVDVKTGSIDTTGRDKQMGAKVRLYSVDNDSYINIPSTWEVISQGTHYAAGGNNFTINLADGLTVTNSNIYIQMSSIGNLPIGKYRLDIDLISGALANYPEDDSALAKNTIKIGIELTDYSYSIKSTMANKNRQLFSNTDANKAVEINLEKTTSAGVSTSGIYVQQTLYKKNEDSGKYESINLDVLFDPSTLPLVNNKLAWDKNVLNYKYKDNVPAGTYRLQFDVMQADAFNDLSKSDDIVRATDTINIVVTSD